ncbi:hypothetical protein SYNTR_1600 [Candidatus Syntrophocurvum alkaliphilum]|uniref:Carboxymuconolactone decarboxylase-like domain-containing protein n=1 Tax=Candidatus Syntrophocurvum alkaliphilum TaxID=2293317 RepID=A0A6I6DJC2_9FIRM|nr:carboxymuconolactone decarboxylase family protein [Candidatus Syntrophocurvum alkaliphilum]QGU00194.1 hypothetical protein SYNTR_1600 [Candidatus Syntrophocurvum alkaliphilum]
MSQKLPWFVEEMKQYDPEYAEVIHEVVSKALDTRALDDKTKLLIVLALDAIKGASEGVKVLAKQARMAGASDEEIQETLRLAYFVSGMDVVKTSLNAFE